jgi:regulator of protease activity HflC (stomatin/prohibitin superfamily)
MEKAQIIRYAVFIIAVIAVVSVLGLIFLNFNAITQNLLWIVLAGIIVVVFWKTDVLLKLTDFQRAVIMRFGKVSRVGGPGWAFLLPGIEHAFVVDLRTRVIDIPKQQVITRDNVELVIDGLLYLKVRSDRESVVNSVVKVQDHEKAITRFVFARLRDIAGSMTMETIITSIDDINSELTKDVANFSERWGLEIERVELQDLDIPKKVLEAMHDQKAAVQEKLARQERAEASKLEIDAINKATTALSDKTIAYYYIKALEEVSKGKSTKLVFPMELSKFANSLSGRLGPKQEINQELVDSFLKRIETKKKDA